MARPGVLLLLFIHLATYLGHEDPLRILAWENRSGLTSGRMKNLGSAASYRSCLLSDLLYLDRAQHARFLADELICQLEHAQPARTE